MGGRSLRKGDRAGRGERPEYPPPGAGGSTPAGASSLAEAGGATLAEAGGSTLAEAVAEALGGGDATSSAQQIVHERPVLRRVSLAPRKPLAALPPDRLDQARRVLLIVIDGLGAELLRNVGRGSQLEARASNTITSVYPPTTASAITPFMTGLAPQQHGLTGWFMHFRRLGAVTAVLPFVPRYGRKPLSGGGVDLASLLCCPSFFDRIKAQSAPLRRPAVEPSRAAHPMMPP